MRRKTIQSLLGIDLSVKPVAMVLSDLESIGVLVLDDDGLHLSDRASSAVSNAAAIRECLFNAVNADDLWEADEKGVLPLEGGRDLVRALAWFSSLDVTEGPYAYKDIDARQVRELGVEVIATSERWLPFARWSSYLGLSRFDPGGGVTPEPSAAIAEVLRASANGPGWDPDRLATTIAAGLPVLDGGVFFASVEAQRLLPRIPHEAEFSSAVTFALLTLKERRLIAIDLSTGDARKGRFAHNLGALSGVRWGGDA